MARNMTAVHVVNRVNAIIRNNINGHINWGTNVIPHANIPAAWFGGTTAGIGATTVQAAVQGNAQAAKLNTMIRDYTRLFRNICRKRLIVYYNNEGTLQAWFDQTSIGNFASGVPAANIASAGTEFRAGTGIKEVELENHLTAMYNSWWSQAGNRTVETLSVTICHTQCHSNCNCNRGRR